MNLEKIRAAAERVARSDGLEVVDVEWKVGKQRFLRVYIDRVPSPQSADGTAQVSSDPYPKISHADCERVSQQLSVILDVEELITGPGYVLEVSSPGMDRALRKPEEGESLDPPASGRVDVFGRAHRRSGFRQRAAGIERESAADD